MRALLIVLGMSQEPRSYPVDPKEHSSPTVLVIGGSGGMSDRYRDVLAEHGCSLRHYENKVPAGARRSIGRIALVVIMVGMVSHALRDQVRTLGIDGAPVIYLRSASVSALRAAVGQWAG